MLAPSFNALYCTCVRNQFLATFQYPVCPLCHSALLFVLILVFQFSTSEVAIESQFCQSAEVREITFSKEVNLAQYLCKQCLYYLALHVFNHGVRLKKKKRQDDKTSAAFECT